MTVRRVYRVLLAVVGLYALAWLGYVVKSALGIDVLPDGVHHGIDFPGSDRAVAKLKRL